MGAFFLFDRRERVDLAAVRDVFARKGFAEPACFDLGGQTLWLYRKQLVNEPNYVRSGQDRALFCVGTPIYRGQSYRATLTSLLHDFEAGALDFDELSGAFCLLFWRQGAVHLLLDRANVYHVFRNRAHTVLSSSFLALVAASPQALRGNRTALLERLLVGYNAGSETLAEDLFLLTGDGEPPKGAGYRLLFYPESEPASADAPFRDFNDCVARQEAALRDCYRRLEPLARQYGADLGLSGGYDSRLNLLLAQAAGVEVTAHTHDSPVHRREKEVAQRLAHTRGVALKPCALSAPEQMGESQLAANLEDAFYFFDGRSNRTMPTFNDVHTRRYRVQTLGACRLGLNGLGGELFRNHDLTYYNRIDFTEWLKYHALGPLTLWAVEDPRTLREFVAHLETKYRALLGLISFGPVDRHTIRRCFAEIWQPYAAGVKAAAENQLAFFLMPFTEHRVRQAALPATRFLGKNARLQAALLERLDPQSARLPSSYGFPLHREPWPYRLRTGMRGYLPDRLKTGAALLKLRWLNGNGYRVDAFLRYDGVRRSLQALAQTGLPVRWERLAAHKTHFERAVFTGYVLLKLSPKLVW